MPNTTTYHRISLVCGPVDEFTFLVEVGDPAADALEEIARQMRDKGVMIFDFENVESDDLTTDDLTCHPVLTNMREVESFIVNSIDDDCGDGPADNTYTVHLDNGTQYTVKPDPDTGFFAWRHAVTAWREGRTVRPTHIDWPKP